MPAVSHLVLAVVSALYVAASTRFRLSPWMTTAQVFPALLWSSAQVRDLTPPDRRGKLQQLINSSFFMFSGPCPPSNVSAQMTCQSSNMTVYWDAIRDADHFLVSLTSVNGTIQLCNTTTTTCFISNATCGETFTIQVTSVRGNCLSRPYQTSSIQTGQHLLSF